MTDETQVELFKEARSYAQVMCSLLLNDPNVQNIPRNMEEFARRLEISGDATSSTLLKEAIGHFHKFLAAIQNLNKNLQSTSTSDYTV